MRFSIIVPVYNVAPWLPQCLDSVLNQTFSDWECICVNDGSTDTSLSMLRQYEAKDRRFVIVDKKNGGSSSARNAGLKCANGEYVVFLDGDDAILPEYLRVISNALEKNPSADIVRIGFSSWDGELIKENSYKKEVSISDVYQCNFLHSIVKSGAMSPLNIIKREKLSGVFFNEAIEIFEDIDFALKLASRDPAGVTIDYNGYLYRQSREGSLTKKKQKESAGGVFLESALRTWRDTPDDLRGKIENEVQFEILFFLKHWLRTSGRISSEYNDKTIRGVIACRDAGVFDLSKHLLFSPIPLLGRIFAFGWRLSIEAKSLSCIHAIYRIYYRCVNLLKR